MAYARYGSNSDVYVYPTTNGWMCDSCEHFSDLNALQIHLLNHRSHGDWVPQDALDVINLELNGKARR